MKTDTSTELTDLLNRRDALRLLIAGLGGSLTSCATSGGVTSYDSYNNPAGKNQGPTAAWLSSTRYLDSIGASAIELHYHGTYSKRQKVESFLDRVDGKKGKLGTANYSAKVHVWSQGPKPGANVVQDMRAIKAAVKEIRLGGTVVASRPIDHRSYDSTPDLKVASTNRDFTILPWFTGALPSSDYLITSFSPSRKAAMLADMSGFLANPVRTGVIPRGKVNVGSLEVDLSSTYAGAKFGAAGRQNNPMTGRMELASRYEFKRTSELFEAVLLESVPLRVIQGKYQDVASDGLLEESLEYSLTSARRIT